ncbi:LysM peptidoglycan-binding domain-containing protein [Lysinibacillus telephonicus]|uniref:LysM peptidoglycan-binding domain-containing protein n=1 Tax=Lysinibacillus telephonicus TaxID=1714840 RepID=UPI0037D09DA1
MYKFFIDGVQLPVAPSEMTTRINNRNETITLINEGEVNILKMPGLTEIEFEALLPNVQYPFAVYPNGPKDFKPATYYLTKLEQLKTEQKPFQFIVNRMLPNGYLLFDTDGMLFSLENYEFVDDAENGFDIVVKITLKQYREYSTKRLKTQPSSGTSKKVKVTVEKQRPTIGKQTPKTYTVVSGDTLWAIAKRYLGDGGKYTELAKVNNLANPNLLRVGQVIKLG